RSRFRISSASTWSSSWLRIFTRSTASRASHHLRCCAGSYSPATSERSPGSASTTTPGSPRSRTRAWAGAAELPTAVVAVAWMTARRKSCQKRDVELDRLDCPGDFAYESVALPRGRLACDPLGHVRSERPRIGGGGLEDGNRFVLAADHRGKC